MNQLYTRRNIIISLAISLTVVSFFVWYTYRNMKKAGHETRTVNTTLQSLRAIEYLMDDMQDIENSHRGYLFSGDKQFLHPYDSALKNLKQDTILIKALYPLYPQRKKILEKLLDFTRRKADFSTISASQLNNYNPDSAYKQMHPDKAREIMDSIRHIGLSLENEDRKILQHSNIQRETAASVTAKLFGVLAIIFTSIMVALFLRIFHDLKRRDINEKKISYLADMVEQTSDAIISADMGFTILSWNKGAEKMYGYEKQEATGKKYHMLLQSRRTDAERDKVIEKLKIAGSLTEEIEYSRKNGQAIFVQTSYTLLRDKNYNITGCSIIHRDITEKKKAEKLQLEFNEKLNKQVQEKTLEIKEVLNRFKIITRATNDVVWDVDLKNGSVWWNDNFYEKLGYAINEETTRPHFWDDHLHPEDKARVTEHINYVLEHTNADTWSNEYRFMKADGSYINIYDRSWVMRDENDKAYRLIGSMADVTDLFVARQELNQSEDRYRSLIEQASDAILMYSFDGTIHNFNISAAALMGYTEAEFSKLNLKDILIGGIIDDPAEYASIMAENAVIVSRQFKRKDGQLLDVEINAKLLKDGKILAIGRDITERKKAEEALTNSELRFRTLTDNAPVGIFQTDTTGKTTYVNEAWMGYTGMKFDEAIGYGWLAAVHPDDRESLQKIWHKRYVKGLESSSEYRLIDKQGNTRWVVGKAGPLHNKNGEITGHIGTIADITERKLATEALQASEKNLQYVLSSTADYFYVIDKNYRVALINEAAQKNLKRAWGTLVETGANILELIPEVKKETIKNNFDKVFKGSRIEYEVPPSLYNEKVWTAVRYVPVIDEMGIIIGASIDIKDITERKEAEKKIIESEERYRTLVENASEALVVLDMETKKFISVSESAVKLFKMSKEELLKVGPIEVSPEYQPDGRLSKEAAIENLNKAIAGEKSSFEWTHCDVAGNPLLCEVWLVGLPSENQLLVRGSIIDISNRKNAEKELNDSYKSIRKLTNHLQNIREEDRAHIAREIHDELGQQLTVLKMDVSWINKKIDTTDDLVKQKMKDLLTMLDETVKTVRRISSELRPSLLDDLGLTAAMEWQLQEFKKRSEIKITFTAPETEIELPDMVKISLFRIFQESLTNVVRHSNAKKLEISLEHKDSNFVLSISDDGKGFDKSKIADKKTLGILGMKERTSMIGGSYKITSTPGKGTMVVVTIPSGVQHNTEIAPL